MATYSELLAAGRFYDGAVCADCLMGIANDDWPAVGDSGWDDDRDATAGANLGAYDVTLGHMHDGKYADTSCFHYGAECDDDCSCEADEFSWRGCSVCGTYLAGYRHDVIMIKHDDLT